MCRAVLIPLFPRTESLYSSHFQLLESPLELASLDAVMLLA